MSGPQAVNREDETAFVKNFIRDIPPVTRVLFFGTLLCTALSLGGILPTSLFIINWQAIAYRFAIWIPFLSPLHAGAAGFQFLIHLYFMYTYSKQVENNQFFGHSAAYSWMLVVCLGVITLMGFIFGFPFAGPALLISIMHLWGRAAGDTRVTLYGIVPIPAKFLSLAVVGLNTVLNGKLSMADVSGLLAGQVYYFLDTVYPTLPNGRNVIFVPMWFERIVTYLEDAGGRALGLGVTNTSVTGPSSGGTYSSAPRGSASGDRRPGLTRAQPRAGSSSGRYNWGTGRTLGSS